MNDAEFLKWIYYRLEEVHKEPRDIDYMIRLRGIVNDSLREKSE